MRSPLESLPTAQTLVDERAVTALSTPPPAWSVGVVWMLQVLPLKNSTSGPDELSPTAQTAVLDRALTQLSLADVDPVGLGVATCDQVVPL